MRLTKSDCAFKNCSSGLQMSDLPTLDGVAEGVRQRTKELCPWLPDPFQCPECQVYTDAERTYDPQRAAFHPMGMAPSWYCGECDTHYVRERD